MPVVINDFQVLDSEPEQSGQGAPPASSSSQTGKEPVASQGREMEKLLRHLKARRCRIHAD